MARRLSPEEIVTAVLAAHLRALAKRNEWPPMPPTDALADLKIGEMSIMEHVKTVAADAPLEQPEPHPSWLRRNRPVHPAKFDELVRELGARGCEVRVWCHPGMPYPWHARVREPGAPPTDREEGCGHTPFDAILMDAEREIGELCEDPDVGAEFAAKYGAGS